MINGIGIDIVEISKLKKVYARKSRFATKILTDQEIAQLGKCKTEKRRIEFLAGRFAAKEAFAKAYGTGIGKLGFKDIEVIKNDYGAPAIHSSFTRDKQVYVSISHSEHYAVAQVVIESERS
ncbi:Holo-[acyl-carrier-protein] synthase [Paraliobacillus sp. PM-2]|uniref:holo-ACP synthase n=1 Tax=Paraliobacillus sp. PM-2 TaxID=1462524 RepID=UPI00061C15C8|nr:holo-ACP synthase [Paraliobacillus sp. PM-2]CQR48272.1 Holo-[acyl-carrier-protein] synthase [Paraliobacillus sp. PM-2]